MQKLDTAFIKNQRAAFYMNVALHDIFPGHKAHIFQEFKIVIFALHEGDSFVHFDMRLFIVYQNNLTVKKRFLSHGAQPSRALRGVPYFVRGKGDGRKFH